MKVKTLIVASLALLAACDKPRQSTYTFVCTSTYQVDPFHTKTDVDTFYNMTQEAANAVVRARADSGWYTVCQRH